MRLEWALEGGVDTRVVRGFGAGVSGSGDNLKEAPEAGRGQVIAGEQCWVIRCGVFSSIFTFPVD